jgi:hypothetical protein
MDDGIEDGFVSGFHLLFKAINFFKNAFSALSFRFSSSTVSGFFLGRPRLEEIVFPLRSFSPSSPYC